MLAITKNAVTAIKGLAASRELPESGGIRISARDDAELERSGSLDLSLAASPAEDDTVVDEHGARVFVERNAAAFLDDKVLDVRVKDTRARFVIADPRMT
jgi:iron-sulfur cluster assembly protein